MGLEWSNCDQRCRYHYRGRCIHAEPGVYIQARTALCLETAEAVIVQAEAIAAAAWVVEQSERERETERLALLADEETPSGSDWTAIAVLLFLAASWTVVVATVARMWR